MFRWGATRRLLLCSCCSATIPVVLCLAASPSAAPKIDPEIRAALDSAAALRVEAAADLVFAILDSGKAPPSDAARYLETLFNRAGEARRDYPTIVVPRAGESEAGNDFGQMLSAMGLNRTGIRMQTLSRLAKSAPGAARELLPVFMADEPPPVDADCRQTEIAVADGAYYRILLGLFPGEFEPLMSGLSTPQQAASLAMALPKLSGLSPDQYSLAAGAVIRALNAAQVSDRVFTATELKMKLGLNIEEFLKTENAPAPLVAPLVQAWVGYVARQLGRERCSDVRTSRDEDMVVKYIVERAQRLTVQYGVPGTDLSRIRTTYSSKTPAAPTSRDLDGQRKTLMGLVAKLKLGGSPEVAARLAQEVLRFTEAGLDESERPFDSAARVAILQMVAATLGAEDAAEFAVEGMFRLLEQQTLKDREPAAWVLLARFTLNLSKHPERAVANRVLGRLRQTRDPDLAAYLLADRLVGLVPEYQADTLGKPMSVFPFESRGLRP